MSNRRAKAKYDDAVSILDAAKSIMADIESDSSNADQARRDVAKNIYRAQVTVDQKTKALHSARAEMITRSRAFPSH